METETTTSPTFKEINILVHNLCQALKLLNDKGIKIDVLQTSMSADPEIFVSGIPDYAFDINAPGKANVEEWTGLVHRSHQGIVWVRETPLKKPERDNYIRCFGFDSSDNSEKMNGPLPEYLQPDNKK